MTLPDCAPPSDSTVANASLIRVRAKDTTVADKTAVELGRRGQSAFGICAPPVPLGNSQVANVCGDDDDDPAGKLEIETVAMASAGASMLHKMPKSSVRD